MYTEKKWLVEIGVVVVVEAVVTVIVETVVVVVKVEVEVRAVEVVVLVVVVVVFAAPPHGTFPASPEYICRYVCAHAPFTYGSVQIHVYASNIHAPPHHRHTLTDTHAHTQQTHLLMLD